MLKTKFSCFPKVQINSECHCFETVDGRPEPSQKIQTKCKLDMKIKRETLGINV